MKFRRITIFGLTLALAGTLTAFAACTDPENTGETPPEYTFEDGRPDGELTAPDEGFEIDGVLDEAAYSSIRWLEGPVLRPYYTSDGQGVYYDYDVIQERTQSAAQVRMGTYYGENGVYIAYSYQEQAGKVCYVNPSRRSYRNSGVELHIGIPSSATMTGDETISRLTVNANGALTIAKTQGDIWMAPYGTEDHANMPYVGLTGNGTRTDENADRTEYTFELFIPWGYFDEVGGEGTAQSMKDGGDLVVAPGIITANNYTGTGQTDREYYVLSARLDDGAWSDAQGWYHFNKEGVVAYDIEIAQPQNGVVQEWMGYDTAAKNSSLTFVAKADEGYALKEFRLNGVAVPNSYIHYDMYTTLGDEAESSVQKSYIKIPQDEITGNVSVEAVFEPLASGEQTLVATVYGESTENPLANATVTFTRGDEVKTATTDENGKFTLSGLTAGLYDVAVNDLTYRKLTDYVFFSPEANAQIVFELNEFALEGSENVEKNYTEIQGKVGSLEGGFVFSGFFGFENASYDDLTNFTCTVYFITDKAASEQVGFRFTKWGNYLMLKYENAEYHFESDAGAVEYFKENKGVWFRFSVDAEGNISAYIERAEGDWVLLSTNTSVQFPIEKGLEAITFSKQDDSNAAHYAVLKDGELKIGTSDVDIPVTVTVNGGEQVSGGTVSVTEDVNLGEKVTVTLTPEEDYIPSLKVDGQPVSCTPDADGVYTYTFTASKQSYVLEVAFEKVAGAYTVNATIAEALTGAADDLHIVLTNGSSEYAATKGEGNVWMTESIPYGTYTIIVTSVSGGYTVLERDIVFEEGAESFAIEITSDNYGDNRKYAISGENNSENGVTLADALGAPTGGYVFEGFLGAGGAADLSDIGSKNFASALRFSTDSGYQYRVCFYIWNGQSWLIKVFEEGNESGNFHEFGFSGNTALINYVKEKNGITVRIGVTTDGNFSVYAMTSDDVWTTLGSWKMPEYEYGKIEKVELLRMFQNGLEGWTATVEGTLSFGSAEVKIPVEFTFNGGEVTGGTIEATEGNIGDQITITVKPDAEHVFDSLMIDGVSVDHDETDRTYTYTFTADKSRYAVEAVFVQCGDVTLTVDTTAVPEAADDLTLTLINMAGENVELTAAEDAWTAANIPLSTYTVIVTSKAGGYTILEQEATFTTENRTATFTISAEKYGDQRKYELQGEWQNESGSVLVENLGAPMGGYVFEGFLGAGGAADLSEIGSKNFASALRFTTDSGYQYRVCFYIWNGKTWLIKVFEEGKENSAQSHEFGFSGNTALIDYIKEKNGITVNIGVDNEGNFSVYAMTSDTEWISLGSWKMTEYKHGKIEKVEVLRMFNNDGWTATVEGELRFGTTDTGIDVTFTGTGEVTGGNVSVSEAPELGEEVTITLTPDDTHVFGSLKVDGQAVICQAGENGVYTYTFTATKSTYQITATFADGGDLTINVTGTSAESGDLTIEVSNGFVTKTATFADNTWTVSDIAYGTYTITVTSKSAGGYTVLTDEVTFGADSPSASIEITADNYGENRKYELQGENDEEYSGGVLAENIGSTESFVFKGFLGITSGSDSLDALKGSQNGSFGAGLRFIMSDGNSFRIAFVANNGTWSIRCYWQEAGHAEHDNVTLTMNETLKSYVSENGGVNIIVVAEMVGGTPVVTIYIESAENTWQQLGTYTNSNIPLNKAIEQVTVTKMWISTNPNRTPYVDGILSFGTTDTGIAVGFSGAGKVTGGEVSVSDSVNLGDQVTITLTPDEGYVFSSLNVDGESVTCTAGDDGVYTYTFTATKSSYTLAAVFEQVDGAYTVNATIAETLADAAEDLKIVLSNGSLEYETTKGEGNVWTTQNIPYGKYTVIVTSISGGYTVLTQEVTFAEGSDNATVNVTADNYGDQRKYELQGEWQNESGSVLVENLGAPMGGYVFEGFLGAGGAADLSEIGSKNFASALRFTTDSGYQYRVCFYIWNGKTWLIKVFEEGKENSAQSHEFGFSGNTALIDYIKEKNGITVNIGVDNEGNFSVYAMTSDTEWISLGSWKMTEYEHGKIEKVEVLRMFNNEGWTATVEGELRFGTTDTGITTE